MAGALLVALSACAPPSGNGGDRAVAVDADAIQAGKVVTIIGRTEPVHLAEPGLRPSGTSVGNSTRPFNATLDRQGSREIYVPYLAEALPELNSDTWTVFPDGRMETRYTLKPNLTWHDGTPLSAEDFVFAQRVYTTPELGVSGGAVRVDMAVSAPDARTIVIQWKRPRPEAAGLGSNGSPLPRHILAEPLRTLSPDAFIGHPYWTQQYIGLGPYKLERWEPGAFLEGVPFAGHVWGKPKIGKLVVRWTTDENTALANILAGSAHLVTDLAIRYEQLQVLKRDWGSSGKGVPIMTPTMTRRTYIQLRPEFADPAFLVDLRVRRALAHSLDRNAVGEGLFTEDGQKLITDSLVRPSLPFYDEVQRTAVKYPYDLRRTEQLMQEAGFSRGSDGVFVSAQGQRASMEIQNQPGAQPERESTLMMEAWRRAGFDVRLEIALSADTRTRHTYPALHSAGGGLWDVSSMATWKIGSAANRFSGDNRAGWSNPEYDALAEKWDTTLDPAARNPLGAAMVRLYTQDVPVLPLFFNPVVSAYLGVLHGPDKDTTDANALIFNVHEWTLD